MNNKRRAELQRIADSLGNVIADEQDAYDNMLEGIQESERGEVIETGLDSLNEAKELLEETANL